MNEDFLLEAEGLKRRRQLLETLSRQQPIVGAPKYALPQALGGVLNAILGQKIGQEIDTEEGANRGKYNEALASGVDRFIGTYKGKPGETMSDQQAADLMQNDVAPQLAEPVPADPQRAVAEALTSRLPEMQGLGKAGLSEMLAEIKAKKATPGYKDETIDGKRVRIFEDGSTKVLGDFKDRDEFVEAPSRILADGTIIPMQRNTRTGKEEPIVQDRAPRLSVTNTPENKGAAAILQTTIEQVMPKGKSYEGAMAAQANLQTTTEALSAIAAGADQGALADFGLQLRKLGERFGIKDAATSPTDQLSSLLKERVFHKLGGLGVAISDADRRFMQESAGDISKDPQAMRRLLALDAAASIKELQRHNSRVDKLVSKGGEFELAADSRFPINFYAQDDEFDQMVANALQGKPTTTAPTPAAPPKTKGKETPKSSYGKPVKIRGF